MTLATGTVRFPYKILAAIGAAGMGEGYRVWAREVRRR